MRSCGPEREHPATGGEHGVVKNGSLQSLPAIQISRVTAQIRTLRNPSGLQQTSRNAERPPPQVHQDRCSNLRMDGRISFLMETGLSQTRWRPVIRRHAVPSDIIAPIRGLSETTGPATQSDAAAGNRASNNIRRAQPPAHTFMAARRLGICPRRRACSPSRSGGPRRHPAHQNRGPAR